MVAQRRASSTIVENRSIAVTSVVLTCIGLTLRVGLYLAPGKGRAGASPWLSRARRSTAYAMKGQQPVQFDAIRAISQLSGAVPSVGRGAREGGSSDRAGVGGRCMAHP